MLAPFSVDTYLPSFPDIAQEFSTTTPVLLQTLSLYLFAFAGMTLVYGPLSDAFGRRKVALAATAAYVACSIGCALAPDIQWLLAMRIGQGLTACGGIVVGRAVIRDAFAGPAAQRAMSQVMLTFAIAPAIAPIVGGWLHDAFGWRGVFWFLALLGIVVWLWAARMLPETLPSAGRQSAHPRSIATAYMRVTVNPRFMWLMAVIILNFGGLFLYISGSPEVVYRHLHYGAGDFGYLFVPLVSGLMFGAFLSGRVAGKLTHAQAVAAGFAVMLIAAAANLVLAQARVHTPVAVIAPVALYAIGMWLAMPNLSLLAMEEYPTRRGLASAVQGFSQTGFNALVAGLFAPLLTLRLEWMAAGMFLLNLAGLGVWWGWQRRFAGAVTDAASSP